MIQFTQGDTALLSLTATDGQGNPVDLTGAVFTTLIKGPNGQAIISFPNSQHTANPDQVGSRGKFVLALSTSGTASCGLGTDKEIITKIVISASTTYFRGVNILEVFPPIPLQ